MADKLTPQQKEAVFNRGGKLLVSAAAGSGKTRVLVDRLMACLTDENDPANLDEFLIITYTKAAAAELRGKIAARLTERIAREPENHHLQKQTQRLFLTKISTVHGFCADILREYAYRLDIPADFRAADENECRELREMVLSDLLESAYAGKDPLFHAFVDNQGLGRNDALVSQIVEKVYDSAKCHLDPGKWLRDCLEGEKTEQITDAAQTVWGRYLMEEMKDCLACQITVMEQCLYLAENGENMEKIAGNLKESLAQMKLLYQADTWDEVLEQKNIPFSRFPAVRKNVDAELKDRIKAARDACKKGLEKVLSNFADPSRQVLADLEQTARSTAGLVALVEAFDRAYSRAKSRRRCLDFSDLEQKTLDLLLGKSRTSPTAAAGEIGSRFREILVDEYQDSNAVQDAIFSALSEKKQNCFMVGDVKQSIYQFRLADPDIFLKKYREYAPVEDARPGRGRKVLLSHNFRSGGEVVEAVNHVFQSCMSQRVGGLAYGEAEALREGMPHAPLPDCGVEFHAVDVREDTYGEEADFVAQRIQEMLNSPTLIRDGDGFRQVTAEDIVILLRSPGSAGAVFQRALEARGIRCGTGGGRDLLQAPEIAVLRSLLQTVYNPRLDIPLISTLASPVFGFTADELAEIRSGNRKGSVYDALLGSEMPRARAFAEMLGRLRKKAQRESLTKLLESCLNLTRLDSVYAAMAGGDTRQTNLQTFFSLAVDFESGGQRDLGQFLEHLTALEERGLLSAGAEQAGAVTIMSIHKSKGLEFPVVFLANLSRTFNREDLRGQILCDKELGLGLSVTDNQRRIRYPSLAKTAIATKMAAQSLSEEMRVLYVALTRARDRLVMTYASRNLEKDIREIALRHDFADGTLLCREAGCPGDWVLKAAMERTEAGELLALGGKPMQTTVSAFPWKITVTAATDAAAAQGVAAHSQITLPEGVEEGLRRALAFRYSHMAATQAPSKQTATQRKGRQKDAEASEQAPPPRRLDRNWRQPAFADDTHRGTEYGNAIHAVMQYIRCDSCDSPEAVFREVKRLTEQGFLTQQQAGLVNCQAIARFFAGELGQRLQSGVSCIREFKFSILDDGSRYGEGLEEEQILLQGVVDCALLEGDGISVIDFKTDYVTEATLPAIVERYRPQVEVYGDALGRIFEMPVKGMYLYFFHTGKLVPLK